MQINRTEPEAFYTTERPALVDMLTVFDVQAEAKVNERHRMRVCLHPGIEDRFHDFVIAYNEHTDIRPHKHLGKDETFVVLDGEAEVIFYAEDGKEMSRQRMEPYGGALPFCVRIPGGTYHTLIALSADLVIYCATPGPFVRSDTVWADWHG